MEQKMSDTMIVMQHASKFTELSRFVPEFVSPILLKNLFIPTEFSTEKVIFSVGKLPADTLTDSGRQNNWGRERVSTEFISPLELFRRIANSVGRLFRWTADGMGCVRRKGSVECPLPFF